MHKIFPQIQIFLHIHKLFLDLCYICTNFFHNFKTLLHMHKFYLQVQNFVIHAQIFFDKFKTFLHIHKFFLQVQTFVTHVQILTLFWRLSD